MNGSVSQSHRWQHILTPIRHEHLYKKIRENVIRSDEFANNLLGNSRLLPRLQSHLVYAQHARHALSDGLWLHTSRPRRDSLKIHHTSESRHACVLVDISHGQEMRSENSWTVCLAL